MPEGLDEQLTMLLNAAADGNARAAEELAPLVYDRLRKLANSLMVRSGPGQTLQPTALVHEAYMKITGNVDSEWDGRDHFFASAAQAMRQILVDQARRKARVKHGGDRIRIDLDQALRTNVHTDSSFLEFDEVLNILENHAPRQAKLVTLRCFGGLTMEQAAAVMGVSEGTAHRDWSYAKAWLRDRLSEDETDGGEETSSH